MPGYLSRLPLVGSFNGASSGGPRRVFLIAGGSVLIVATIFGVSTIQTRQSPVSSSGRLPAIDPTPGGVNSNAQQDKLHLVANQAAAERALQAGKSYTPVMASSQAYITPRVVSEPIEPARSVPVIQPAPPPPVAPARTSSPTPAIVTPFMEPLSPVRATLVAVPAPPATVAQPPARTPKEEADLKLALDKMMAGWGGRAPRTDVILPPDDAMAAQAGPQTSSSPQGRRTLAANDERVAASLSAATSAPSASARQRVLVPAGRGVYAHTILAANSDQQSPVILQADGGPLSGDRMLGSFSRERDRLVIRISKVIHNGQEIGAEGIVVAPSTMEVGVASSVDQNYLSRFLLPAAAAFVQGLGQAIAQSNSTSVVGPLGSVAVQNRLNLDQQLGIGAGVAGAQIGSTLQQSAPRGPTVILDVGSSVGVMFLSSVMGNP